MRDTDSSLGPGAPDVFAPDDAPRTTGLRLSPGTTLGLAVTARPTRDDEPAPFEDESEGEAEEVEEVGGGEPGEDSESAPQAQPFVRPERKVGRNEPCPCGSGKKYKHCHGRLQ